MWKKTDSMVSNVESQTSHIRSWYKSRAHIYLSFGLTARMNDVVHVKVEIVVLISVGVGLGDVDRYCNTIDFLGVFLNHIGSDLGILVCKPRRSIY